MKTNLLISGCGLPAALAALTLIAGSASATTFTSDTIIGVNDGSFDGVDIVISNCVVTVDGPHAFNSLRLRNGATLTHTAANSGNLQFPGSVSGELQTLSLSNNATLTQSNVVIASIVVRDITGTNTYSNGTDYSISQNGAFTLLTLVPGSLIAEGDTVQVDYSTLTIVPTGLNLDVAGNVIIESGGAIDANGRGYGAGSGPGLGFSQGSPNSGSGGGHGGYGGLGLTNTQSGLAYDSIMHPTNKGSGGGAGTTGAGGSGGGAIRLNVGGLLQIDGGISANGANATNSRAGGGSGGSILLTASTITGAGSISADGGAGEPVRGGGGGGGEIAIYSFTNLFSGTTLARGGIGFGIGGAGTIFAKDSTLPGLGQMIADNGGRAGTNTLLSSIETFDVIVRGKAIVAASFGKSVGNLLVESNSWLVNANAPGFALLATGNVTLQAGGGILADGKGSSNGFGTGAGGTTNAGSGLGTIGGGGGYGGAGGAGAIGPAGGETYGSLNQPTAVGSGGGPVSGPGSFNAGGAAGGGSIQLQVLGTLQLDGKISANGNSPLSSNTGGGSGGSVLLKTTTLTGSGTITANGGTGNGLGGGGGGGRISLTYDTNIFSGIISAFGGGGVNGGGAGTIYKSRNIIAVQSESVLVDNGGRSGAKTSLGTFSSFTADLTVTGGALLAWPQNSLFTIRNLLVTSNAVLAATNLSTTLTVTSNATIQAGGWLKGDPDGFVVSTGPNGSSDSSPVYGPTGGGGGHAGFGSPSISGALGGGPGFDNPLQPNARGGSGAPISSSPPLQGGSGGSPIRLTVTGRLQVDGKLTTDGHDGNSLHSGGGAGGALWITAGTLAGAGTISANGGRGNGVGGSGGGGCIAVYLSTNNFAGALVARGGGGINFGGAGTVYTKLNSQPFGLFTVDNGGPLGALTSFSAAGADLTLGGGAILMDPSTSTVNIHNLLINSNSFLLTSNRNAQFTISGNATIQAGGAFTADNAGFPSAQGPGAGRSITVIGNGVTIASGAGHGGTGGVGSGGAVGGFTYEIIPDASQAGSGGGAAGGGAGGGNFGGGAGGGLIRLTVTGTLQVNGLLSANAGPGLALHSGGGSGGALRLSVTTLSGNGTISANGGAGNGLGGGGGGGRIFITQATNNFTGTISAFGAGGFAVGGAGTIYLQPINQSLRSRLFVDNGGPLGALTPLPTLSTIDLNVNNGAFVSLATSQPSLNNLFIGSNAFLLATNITAMSISSNVTILAGGTLSGEGAGLGAGSGLGGGRTITTGIPATSSGSGGGHAGAGGISSGGALGGLTYDSATLPNVAGSGGGGNGVTITSVIGGSGGGLMVMTIGGNLVIDGTVNLNGAAGGSLNGGGGAGGSLRLAVFRTFSGAGSIFANGGAGYLPGGGGGGGGCIAITSGTNIFSGLISAAGGNGFVRGGAGTIYLKDTNQPIGQITLDNGGISGAASGISGSSPVDLILQGGTIASLISQGLQIPIRNLLIKSNAFLLVSTPSGLSATNATIQLGGGLLADGTGSLGGQGPGAGRTITTASVTSGSGGGHAGLGANSSGGAVGGGTYDSHTNPSQSGSGGGSGTGTGTNALGGNGGGVMQIFMTGNLLLDGSISANGSAGNGLNSGGGSGGSIYMVVGTLSGTGRISANGGAGNGTGGGGGGGGRIGLNYGTNTFTGITSAFGGNGFIRGGAGTIFVQPKLPVFGKPGGPFIASLLLDNGGSAGALTPMPSLNSSYDLAVQNGARGLPTTTTFMHNLLISSNASVIVSNNHPQLTVTGSAVIEAGGDINSDGTALADGPGQGAVVSSAFYGTTGGGGGHGGFGAISAGGAGGGGTYDSILAPAQDGSSGGSTQDPAFVAKGGGSIHLAVTGSLKVDGRISADGRSAFIGHNGGGSGGSVWLSAAGISGNGTLSANGGAGSGAGGAGGGGRIALYYQTNTLAGPITARGALGLTGAGGAGTIYTKASNQFIGPVLIDNGGLFGAATPVPNLGAFNLTVAGGAMAYPQDSYLILSNLFVNADGLIISGPGRTNLELTVLSNTVVAPGGVIAVDGLGFAQANGPGTGFSVGGFGGGGGYGGAGGNSWTAAGGGVYGSLTEPVDRGSGGGLGSGPTYSGSQGGGAIRLNVGGTLIVDGSLTANGVAGSQDSSGGGSGGSIWAIARIVRGNGSITANGGDGEFYGGGGGGGGRIALYYLSNPGHTNTFTGDLMAFGGEGANWGEDGSVLYSAGLPALRAISHTPTGVVSNAVASVDVVFNTAVNSFSATSGDVVFTTPSGILSSNLVSFSVVSPYSLRINLPLQTAVGNYSFDLGPQIEDIFGRSMAQVYNGAFSIVLPVIEGTITDTNGLPVPGVLLQTDIGYSPAITDVNGHYALGFLPGSSFTVTPSFAGNMFAPGSLSYTTPAQSVTNQDFLMVATIAPTLSTSAEGSTFTMKWQGLPGVTYQVYCSYDLNSWEAYGPPIPGTNAPMEIPLPMDKDPVKFFRLGAGN